MVVFFEGAENHEGQRIETGAELLVTVFWLSGLGVTDGWKRLLGGGCDSGAPRACPGPRARVGSHRCAGGSGQSTQTGSRYQVGPPFTRARKSGSLWLKQKGTWPAHIPRELRSGSGFGHGVQAQAILSDSFSYLLLSRALPSS